MKRILNHNLGLKIISVVIAFFVWLAVVYVSDPLVTGRQEIMLEVLNEDVMTKAGLAYEIEGKRTTVPVTYTIHTQDRASISASDLRAYVDLEDYYPATGTVPVYVEVLNNKGYLLETITARPAVVRIKTEQIQKKDFELQVHRSITMAEGYEVERIDLDKETVTVEGPESVIGRISSIGIEVEAEDLDSEVSKTAVPNFYDANGNKLSLDERVKIDAAEIGYTIRVMKAKWIHLEFEVSGSVADGCRYMGMDVSASDVSVMGADGVVSLVDVIHIPASVLDLGGAAEDKVIDVDVAEFLPDKENMSIVLNRYVTVTLRVRRLSQKTIEVPTNRIILEEGSDLYYYDYDQDTVEVTLEGLEEDLEPMNASNIILELTVSGMEAGHYNGVLAFEGLRDGVSVVGYSPFQVLVSQKDGGPGTSSVEGESSSQEPGELSHGETDPDGRFTDGDLRESAPEDRAAPANAPAEDPAGETALEE